MNNFFDIDCNLTHEDLRKDVPKLLAAAQNVGVTAMLVPGTTLETSREAIQLGRLYPQQVFPTAGVHPFHAVTLPSEEELESLRELSTQVFAVGECGLDYSDGFPSPATQQTWFESQLRIACAVQKPLFLHERGAFTDFMEIITKVRSEVSVFPNVVVHCFTGNQMELQAYIRSGFYIGITGYICKKHGASVCELLKQVPKERLMIETDAPYMGFKHCRRNESDYRAKKQYPNVPSALPFVAETVAVMLEMSVAQVAQLTLHNARRFLML
uniref:Uncharacterized protein AlNc14C130G6941 n=1 Tax=Albugo laibachii Nc14 TaxID=890382 RepID=F0WK89_9STRA|nr:conserved unknown protein putative [Albugo laibachii Nc14]|eukprot:CCA21692.1 conserved unknown protein putative [Albugo laibachii Nc14]